MITNYYAREFNFQTVDFQTLKLFSLICEGGSIGFAAKQTNLATSAVSKRISDLEKHLMVDLFIRHNRGVKPTVAGECLAKHAKQIINQLDDAQNELQELNSGQKSHIRLHANSSAILQFLAPKLTEVFQQAKDVKINLVERLSPTIAQDIISGVADIGICNYSSISKEQLKQLQTKFYRQDNLVLLVPNNHPLLREKKINFQRALDYDFIGYETSSSIDFLVKQAANAANKVFKSQIQVSNVSSMLVLIQQGLALGIVPNFVAMQANTQQQFNIINLDEAWTKRSFHIIVRDFSKLDQPSAKLIKVLTANNN